MKHTILSSIIISLLAYMQVTAQTTIIHDVNLVDVATGRIIPKQDVRIENGKIASITTSRGTVNEQYPVIFGSGKYLMPGMMDGHIHFFQTGELYTRPDAIDLTKYASYEDNQAFAWELAKDSFKRYLRLGITTVMDVGGPLAYIKVRDSLATNTLSPNILITGPLFSPYQPEAFSKLDDAPIAKINTIAEADALFKKLIPHKPDFLKIWYIHSAESPAEAYFPVVKHIAELAHNNDIKLAVHATQLQTAKLAVQAGADILVHSVDDTQVDEAFAKALTDNNVAYIPTLIVSANYGKTFISKPDNHPQDLKYANPKAYGTLTDLLHYPNNELPPFIAFYRQNEDRLRQRYAREDSIMFSNLRFLRDHGVNILAGTDAGNIGTMHASSFLQELEAMHRAGMTIPEIIKAATINAAIGFGVDTHLGEIAIGKQADLVLLEKNPFEDLSHLNNISLVFKDGETVDVSTIIEESPEAIVQRQLNAYNARDIEAFLDTYADDIQLYNFPDVLQTDGKAAMRESFLDFFENTPDLHCEIKNRITISNKVIDQEYITANGQNFTAVAIYETKYGKITKVTFIR